MRTTIYIVDIILMIALSLSAASCGGGGSVAQGGAFSEETIEMHHSSLLTLTENDDFTKAVIRNPWDTTKTLHTYILVPSDRQLPVDLPSGTLIRTPVTNALVFSAVHVGLLKTLGAFDAVKGVCDAGYMHDPLLNQRLANGSITDCGNGMNPDLEKIMLARPQAVLLSPFQNGNNSYGKIAELGIPIIECADYMENSPLGRAEWMKFYGLLFGKSIQADSLFDDTERRYMKLKSIVDTVAMRPCVLMDQRYGQVWNIPAKNSTMGIFITDAGGTNPFAYLSEGAGSVALSPEKVLAVAHDADIWLVRYNQQNPMSLEQLSSDAPVNSRFKALRNSNVYGCNTAEVDFYGEIPFHPDRLLTDLISILHPELDSVVRPQHRYFTKIK